MPVWERRLECENTSEPRKVCQEMLDKDTNLYESFIDRIKKEKAAGLGG